LLMKDRIAAQLEAGLSPSELTVVDESHLHAGHAGARPGGQTHFRVDIVSERFLGKSRVERHRMVHARLAGEFADGIHALALRARAPGEA